jgi:hypothetical protein
MPKAALLDPFKERILETEVAKGLGEVEGFLQIRTDSIARTDRRPSC